MTSAEDEIQTGTEVTADKIQPPADQSMVPAAAVATADEALATACDVDVETVITSGSFDII